MVILLKWIWKNKEFLCHVELRFSEKILYWIRSSIYEEESDCIYKDIEIHDAYEDGLSMFLDNRVYYIFVLKVFLTKRVSRHVLFILTAVQDKCMLVWL